MNRSLMLLMPCLFIAVACKTFTPAPSRPDFRSAWDDCFAEAGAPGAPAREESEQIARRVLEDAFATLGNEFPDEKKQYILRDRMALQRYPRLTFPALVDPTRAAPGGARRGDGWFVPLLVDVEQIGGLEADQVPGALGFWLVRHGRYREQDPSWVDITGCLVREGGSPLYAEPFNAGPGLLAEDRGEVLRGLVFEIPSRAQGDPCHVAPGFYDVKVFPRLYVLEGLNIATPALAAIVAALREADVPRALGLARSLSAESLDTSTAATELREIAGRVWDHVAKHFARDLATLARRYETIADVLEERPSQGTDDERWRADLETALARAERPLRAMMRSRHSLAPVALKDPADSGCDGQGCVRFALAGDIQYHGNLTALQRFLSMFDAGISQPDSGPSSAVPPPHADIDFVLFAGDLADAAAASAGMTELGLNLLGVLPPASPYGEDGAAEMPQLRDQLAVFQKPFFAVPGNHDGYAGYGGLLNVAVDELGELFGLVVGVFGEDAGRSVENGIKSANNVIPTGIGWRLLSRKPRYDGLGEWQHYFGPLNTAFKFRGHSFIGLNSYDLTAKERGSVGAVIINYGGGIQDGAVEWMEDMVGRFSPDPGKKQFLFMHHDPRAAHPLKTRLDESDYGIYDATDSPISMLTLGHAGIGNSPETGIYLPVITVLVSNLARTLEREWGENTGTWMQEWMRKPDWSLPIFEDRASWGIPLYDHSHYNARELIEIINANLAREGPNPKAGISHLVFAHNDVPSQDLWGDPEQRGAVFREPADNDWDDTVMSSPILSGFGSMVGIKYRNGNPTHWARNLRLAPDENATVLRLDDIGNAHSYHGFHVVTLHEDGRTEIEWVGLPN